MKLALDTPLQYVRGVGPKRAELFAKLGLRTVGELLEYFPFRYEVQAGCVPIRALRPGTKATIRGRVVEVQTRPRGGAVVAVSDETGVCVLRWFRRFRGIPLPAIGDEIIATGKVQEYRFNVELVQPRVWPADRFEPADREGGLVGVYRATEGLTSELIARTVARVLEAGLPPMPEPLPEPLLCRHRWPRRDEAIRQLHRPRDRRQAERARQRMAYEELLMLEIALALRRRSRTSLFAGIPLEVTDEIDRRIRRRFPFALTAAQDRVIREICRDLASGKPMTRLLQGDVGSGKTVVAVYAALVAIAHGHQVAIMAPTSVLARQHFDRIERYLAGSRVRRALLVGGLTPARRRALLEQIERGEVDLVVGTQALIQQDVNFARLALVVVDEQHKFGVLQRALVRTKGPMPHYLVMTATPIPRTLSMTVFGDLDVSIIDAMPPGRGKVITKLVGPDKWLVVMGYVRRRLERGERAYVVCPAIGAESDEATERRSDEGKGAGARARGARHRDECAGTREHGTGNREQRVRRRRADPGASDSVASDPVASGRCIRCSSDSAALRPGDADELRSVVQVHQMLAEGPWRGLRVEILHGGMKEDEKRQKLTDFAEGRLHAIVSTTVVEVGVDVPEATIMIVEQAERFGLAQLHQLRGRIGRGQRDGLCVLIARGGGEPAWQRLSVLTRTTDGFRIAEQDLRLRGPGELFGTRQHGLPELRVADLVGDEKLLVAAREDAIAIVDADPLLEKREHAALRATLLRRYRGKLELLDAG